MSISLGVVCLICVGTTTIIDVLTAVSAEAETFRSVSENTLPYNVPFDFSIFDAHRLGTQAKGTQLCTLWSV